MDKYREYLDAKSAAPGVGGRYATMSTALEAVAAKTGPVRILELGTSRSFVDGAFEGCNSNDVKYWQPNNPAVWDHGAGLFTYLANEYMAAHHPDYVFETVDLCADHIARCKVMTQPFAARIRYHVSDSVGFLSRAPRSAYDLIYVDTGDMTPIEDTARHQLKEAEVICARGLVKPGGLVLIDDVRHPAAMAQGAAYARGKATYSLQHFVRCGFQHTMDEFQSLLVAPP